MGVSDYVLRILMADAFVVDVVFLFVTLLALSLFVLAMDFTIQFARYVSDFVKFQILPRFSKEGEKSELLSLIVKLQDRRNELYWELDQIEDRILELMPVTVVGFIDNKLSDKSSEECSFESFSNVRV